MKQWIFTCLFVTLLTLSVVAQDDRTNYKFKLAPDGKAQIEMSKPVEAGMWVELQTTKGAPYSATVESETIQMLMDGNRIRNKTTTNIVRDSEGRIRREIVGTTPNVPAQVIISDPVTGTAYTLNPKQRMAVKSQVNVKAITVEVKKKITEEVTSQVESTPQVTFRNKNGQPIPLNQLSDEQKRVATDLKRLAEEKKGVSPDSGAVAPKQSTTRESLGQQLIEGVMCEGKRTTITLAANSIGNDLPITIVSEEWYSPELQVLVLTKQTDPRRGETTYRLTNINRSEPARSLFEVPADYTIRENAKEMPMKKWMREEQ